MIMDQVVIFSDKAGVSSKPNKAAQDDSEYQKRLKELKDKYGES
jgi:hypothetical protein